MFKWIKQFFTKAKVHAFVAKRALNRLIDKLAANSPSFKSGLVWVGDMLKLVGSWVAKWLGSSSPSLASLIADLKTMGANAHVAYCKGVNWIKGASLVGKMMKSNIPAIAAAGSKIAAFQCTALVVTSLWLGTYFVSKLAGWAYKSTVVTAIHGPADLQLVAA